MPESGLWKPLRRSFDNERHTIEKNRQIAVSHPLMPHQPKQEREVKVINRIVSTTKKTSGNSPMQPVMFDPLSGPSSVSIDPMLDPLSAMNLAVPTTTAAGVNNNNGAAGGTSGLTSSTSVNDLEEADDSLNSGPSSAAVAWAAKKLQIKNDYKVVGNIVLSSSAVRDFHGSGVEDGSGQKQVDLYSTRLANLEKKQLSDDTVEMSQKECESHINKLFKDLERAWSNDERVQSLKIGIQLAKLLVDTTVPQFYPSMFVMVTDNLDKFGSMVYARLKGKSEEIFAERGITNSSTKIVTVQRKKVTRLIADFNTSDVPTEAKETCRNWFYKIACIRELLPRIYVEIALLKCYRFLSDNEFQQIFLRIGSLIRGLGDPIVSLYCRLYLVVVSSEVAPEITAHLPGLLQDILFGFQMLKEPNHLAKLKKYKLTEAEYSHLLSPAVEFLLKIVAKKSISTKELFQALLQSYRDYSMDLMVLRHFMEAFDPRFYAHGALGMVALIKTATVTCISPTDAYATLARQLVNTPPPEEQRIPLLNEVWKVVSKTDDIAAYIRCCTAWVDVVQKHYSDRELLILMSDCSNKLSNFKANGGEVPESVSSYLEALVTSLMTGFGGSNKSEGGDTTYNIDAIFTSEHFLKILDVFKGPRKVAICKDIMHTFRKHANTNDAILINFMFDIGRTLHDSIDVLSPEGEKRHVASLLCSFIDKIDFGRDLEQQLNQYVECRAIFCNLDQVKDKLINCVCNLAMKCYYVMRRVHSKRTSSFVKACLAYCHITVPSIGDTYRKLQLLLYCAEVALQNQCLPQTDTCLKSAISLIPEMPSSEEIDGKVVHTEDKLLNIVRQLLSLLVIAPGHPEHGPFYVVKGLFNALGKYQWQSHTGVQTRAYLSILALLNVYSQSKFPYRMPHVESNDELYGSSPGYMEELGEVTSQCMDEIIRQLTALTADKSDNSTKVIQTKLLLELNCQLASSMEFTDETVAYMGKLLELVNRNKASLTAKQDIKFAQVSVESIMLRVKRSSQQLSGSGGDGDGESPAQKLLPVLKSLAGGK